MRVFQNLDTNGLISALNFPEAIRINGLTNTLPIKRGDSTALEWLFGRPYGAVEELAGTPTLKFGAKVVGDKDGSLVVSNWSGVAWAYTKSLPASVADAVLNETATVTSATAGFAASDVGKVISGAGIPVGTLISSVESATSLTMSAAATVTGAGRTIAIAGRQTTYTLRPAWSTPKLNNLLGNDPNGFAEVTEIRTTAGDATGVGFKIFDAAGSVGVWIDLDNAGAAAPSQATACARQIEITTINTGDTAAQKATKIAAALTTDGQWTATAEGALVTVTDAAIGPRTAAADFAGGQATGFGVSRWIQGSAPRTMANLPYVDLDGELEVTTAGGEVFSTLAFTVRVYFDVIQGTEGQAPDPTPGWGEPIDYIQIFPTITGYVGGTASDLDSVPTVTLPVNCFRAIDHPTEGLRIFRLVAGTDAEASPGVIRPDDYAASTNEKVWKLRL